MLADASHEYKRGEIAIRGSRSPDLGEAPPTARALGELVAIEQREQGRVDPSGIVADGPHGCADTIAFAGQQQLVGAPQTANWTRSRAHRDLAATHLCPQHAKQVALVGIEVAVGQLAAARAQAGQQLAAAQARALAQESNEPPPNL